MSDFLKTPFRRPAPILSWHWLFALCLLVVNDHLLKGSGLLPGWLTGKLSDFAGLYVAPLVVATLCGVRRRFPWWLCHLLVGVGFSAIQLSEPFARIVETATQLLGIQCRIWSDPTDLIALPVLLLSVLALAPKPKRAFRGSAPARSNGWTRGAEHLVLALGALACVASSDPGNREFNTSSPALRNESDAPVEVRILPLRSDLVLNCDELARDPGALFSAEAFGPAVRFSLAPNQNVPVEQRNQMGTSALCDAALLDVDGGRQHLVFWDTESSETFEPETNDRPRIPKLIAIRLGSSENAQVRLTEVLQEDEERALFAFEPRLDSPGQCAEPIAEQVWLSNVPAGSQVLRECHEGADGCTRLSFGQELQALPERAPALSEADGGLLHSPEGGDAGSVSPGAQDAGAPEPTDPVGPAPRVYPYSLELCVPSDVIPFSAGDEVQVVSTSPATLEVSSHQATLTVFRVGGESGQFETTAVSAQDSACPWQVIDTPLQTKRPASLLFQTELGSVTLENGESRTQLGTVSQVTLGNLGSFELALSAREAAAPKLTHFLSGYRLERDVF